ncbi:hypothetical protein PMAYCL1PPCAC_16266, partial [Pristionchus mayeri]
VAADDSNKYVTFHELQKQAHSVRAFLVKRGFKEGEVACLVLSNCIEWAVFALGTMAAGGTVSGASAMFTDYELERQFADSHCTIVLTDDGQLPKVHKKLSKTAPLSSLLSAFAVLPKIRLFRPAYLNGRT